MTDGWPRTRAALVRWFGVALVALVVCAALGGWVTYGAHADSGTTTEERVVSSWETSGESSHSARVVRDTTVFEEGTELSDRSIYYTTVSPVLNGTSQFSYEAPAGELTADADVSLVLEGVETVNERQVTLWRIEEPLASRNATLAPGETLAVDYAVNVSKLANRTAQIQGELGGGGEVRTRVETNVSTAGTVDGQSIERAVDWALDIDAGTGTYRVTQRSDPGGVYDLRTEVVEVPRDPGPLREAGGPLLLAVGLLGLVGLLAARHRGLLTLDDADRAAIAYADDRSDFDEWITTIRLPEGSLEGDAAEAASLADLVDFAIDADEGVIEDPVRGAYVVFHDGQRYEFRPPEGTAVTGGDGPGDGGGADDLGADDGSAAAGVAGGEDGWSGGAVERGADEDGGDGDGAEVDDAVTRDRSAAGDETEA